MSQGSTGNVIAAVCSFFIPGLGQLVQGRVLAAIIHFVLAASALVRPHGLAGASMVDHRCGALEALLGRLKQRRHAAF